MEISQMCLGKTLGEESFVRSPADLFLLCPHSRAAPRTAEAA